MAIQIQLRRGTTQENKLFKGQPGEVTMDTDKKNFRIHDNVKQGGWEVDKADDVVHKTNNQTEDITGVKNFQSEIRYTDTSMDETTAPTSVRIKDLTIRDKNANTVGRFGLRQETNKTHSLEMVTQKTISNTIYKGFLKNNINQNTECYLDYSVDKDGDGSSPTNLSLTKTSTSASDSTIPTMGWVNRANNGTTYYNNVTHINGTETISGEKTYSAITKHNHEIVGASLGSGAYAQFRAIGGNYGFMIRNDGSSTYFLLTASGGQYGTWNDLRPWSINNSNGAVTCGTSWTFSQDINGTATKAKWADLAENYQSDEKYPAGTLIKFGGEKDITIAHFGESCNGVISERPGFLLDNELEDGLPVALSGKTPVRVIGKVNKFDRLVLSPIAGVAKVKASSDEKVIAIALEASDNEEEKLVKCVTKFNLD